MRRQNILLVDSTINLILGILLVFFPPRLLHLLGVPTVEQAFYPNLLGAVLVGIGIALLIEYFRSDQGLVGLGLGGASPLIFVPALFWVSG